MKTGKGPVSAKAADVNLCFLFSLIFTICMSFAGAFLPLPLRYIVNQALMLLPYLVCIFKDRLRDTDLGLRGIPAGAGAAAALYGVCIYPVMAAVNLFSRLFADNIIVDQVAMLTVYPVWVTMLCVALVPAVCEEFIYRGVIYGACREAGETKAILYSSLLFALMHMNLNQSLYAFVMGCFFVLLRKVTGSVLPSMLIHFVFNALSVVSVYKEGVIEQKVTPGTLASAFVPALVGAVGAVCMILWLKRKYPAGEERSGSGERILTGASAAGMVVCLYVILSEFL